MTPVPLPSLVTATLRANPAYELVLFDRLSPAERGALAPIAGDPDLYGVLRPRGEGLSFKSVSREAALLFLTLKEPGALPAYFVRGYGERAAKMTAELVLDGVLELQHGERFLCGAAAHPHIFGETAPAPAETAVARLSTEALRYAQALELDDAPRLSARLYFYNRAPASPRWRRALPTEDRIVEHLGLGPKGRVRRKLARAFHAVEPSPGLEGWRMWSHRAKEARGRLGYKLYVSPGIDQLPEALAAAVDVFGAVRVPRFKIGADLHGLLRPDKLVAYLETPDELMTTAERLGRLLSGMPAQGVPFTSEIAGGGLLSWGMDPPRVAHVPAWQEQMSWRLWLAQRLATAIVLSRSQASAAMEPWQFAIERMRLEGVDPSTWTPAHSIWKSRAAGEG